MSDWTSDFIITLSLIIGGLVVKLLPRKPKWGWQLLLWLVISIILSIIGHLIVKLCI